MENHPKVSVVTVSFNTRDCIEKTIKSVLGQTYDNVEYLIIDGGSTDGAQEIIGRYADKIDCFISERDRGLYDGMNKGIAAATGDYIIFMNADDVFADDRVLADVAAFAALHPEAEVIFGGCEQVWEHGTYTVNPQEAAIGHKMAISHQATFVKLSVIRTHPFDLSYRYAADFEQLSHFHIEGRTFERLDRTIARVEMRGGTTHDHEIESAEEMYSIIESRGIDIAAEKKRILRHKRMVRFAKTHLPGFISRPLFAVVGKVYKPL